MDPIANIIEQLLLVQSIEEQADTTEDDDLDLTGEAIRLAELTRALHEWIIGGGFNPYQSTQALSDIKRQARARGWKG